MQKTAVVLFNLGGPDSLDAVQPFLYNLFCDPYIISLPLGFLLRKPLARYIAKRRAVFVGKQYARIGGKSPIKEWTEKQRELLEKKLHEKFPNVDVFVAMRYWHPFTYEAVERMKHTDYTKILLMPLYPHYSKTTTGSSFAEWERVYPGNSARVVRIDSFYGNTSYISAINRRIDEALLKFPESVRNDVRLLFSAHGTPVSLVKQGDPYKSHVEATVEAVMVQRKLDREHSLCFQSRVGPEEWLKPATNTAIKALSRTGKKHLLVVPISFVSDHIETLFECERPWRGGLIT